MTNEEYISLQLSPFYVRCDEDYHGHVYVRGQEELVEVTKELTAEQKNVLIEDLIYAISELVKDKPHINIEEQKEHQCVDDDAMDAYTIDFDDYDIDMCQ